MTNADSPNDTYYNRPLLKRPHWDRTVTTYLFLGGIMGGSAILAMLAGNKAGNDRKLARNARYVSFVLSVVAPGVLITHLGRPERFHHMMRVVKVKSPMSLGVWGLIGFSAVAAPNALLARFAPRWMSLPLWMLGGFIMSYTGVLLSASANPLWAKGKYHIPAMSVCSGLAGACALHTLLLSRAGVPDTLTRLAKIGVLASVAEGAIVRDFERYAGRIGKPMFEGKVGERFHRWTFIAGTIVPVLLNGLALFQKPSKQHHRDTLKAALAACLTLAGGYVLRDTLIEAGKLSADDPTVASKQPR